MNIATTPTNEEILKKEDPYIYGWRYAQRTLPDGKVKQERVPLTLYDILHPQVGDYRMHSEEHERFCTYLYNVLSAQLTNTPNAVVLHDVRVAWAHGHIEAHGPDIAVIFNVRRRQNWSTFDEAQEETKPSLIIEITSLGTRSTDLVNKVKEYAMVGVPCYVIIDSFQQKGLTRRRLLGYRLTPAGYAPLPPNEHGWLWLEPVGIWVGWPGDDIVCYDDAGNPIQDYVSIAKARTEEVQARVGAEARATAAEERVRQLEAELRRLRGGERE